MINDAQLAGAITSATEGHCIVLEPGVYGSAVLPGGVSLLGKGADFVQIGYVELGAGNGAWIRGLAVIGEGIKVGQPNNPADPNGPEGGTPATGVTIDSVRVASQNGDGLELRYGSSATIQLSEIHGAARYALSAFDPGNVNVEASILNGAKGPGMWAQIMCPDPEGIAAPHPCFCTDSPNITISNTIIRDTKLVGLHLVGVHASLQNVEISGNTVDDHFQPGGGLAVSGCAVVDAAGLRVLDNTNFGVLVDTSTVSFGTPNDVNIEVSRNLRGIWVQSIGGDQQQFPTQHVTLRGAELLENAGVGLGIDQQSLQVNVYSSTIRDTDIVALPVLVDGVSAGAQEVGDGLNWFAASSVILDGLTLSGSARQSVLIDGDVGPGSSIDNVTLEGGDELLGILQQNFVQGGVQPVVGSGAPDVTTATAEVYPIAEKMGLPPGI